MFRWRRAFDSADVVRRRPPSSSRLLLGFDLRLQSDGLPRWSNSHHRLGALRAGADHKPNVQNE